jgi:hypothetical protein
VKADEVVFYLTKAMNLSRADHVGLVTFEFDQSPSQRRSIVIDTDRTHSKVRIYTVIFNHVATIIFIFIFIFSFSFFFPPLITTQEIDTFELLLCQGIYESVYRETPAPSLVDQVLGYCSHS